jgi:hypothetical protein
MEVQDMKRLLAGVMLAAVFVVSLASVVQASTVTGVWNQVDQLQFRTHKLTASAGEQLRNDVVGGTACVACAVDSSISNRLGTQISILDTTTAISTSLWARPTGVSIAAADTNMTYAILNVFDGGSSSSTADSIYVMAQASYDGVAWFSLATLLGGTAGATVSRLDQTQGTGTFFGLLNKLGASGGTPSWAKQYKLYSLAGAANDHAGIWRYPLLRFIIGIPDAVNYSIRAQVIHGSVDNTN